MMVTRRPPLVGRGLPLAVEVGGSLVPVPPSPLLYPPSLHELPATLLLLLFLRLRVRIPLSSQERRPPPGVGAWGMLLRGAGCSSSLRALLMAWEATKRASSGLPATSCLNLTRRDPGIDPTFLKASVMRSSASVVRLMRISRI